MDQVRSSTARVLAEAVHVAVSVPALEKLASVLRVQRPTPLPWRSCSFHYTGPSILDYIFAIDTVNFCFWPNPGLEYDTLAGSLKAVLEVDSTALSPQRLASISEDEVAQQFFAGRRVDLLDERTRLLREVGTNTLSLYGDYETLIRAADHSAVKLVNLVTAAFPGFRDHTIYKGRQVFFYKRAQILVGDLWGAFEAQQLGDFPDISSLTMFPDYRVPQILRHHQVLVYSSDLAAKVDAGAELPAGGPEEVEIRAATVQACDLLRVSLGLGTAVETDWLLWQVGEEAKDTVSPHHRTLSIYY